MDRKGRDDFNALITAAAWNQNTEVIRVLLKAGAKANVKTVRETRLLITLKATRS
jgi:ankyrin repeat protein